MNRFRFSLARLMLVVLCAALACAGLRFANELWASAVWTATLGFLFVAVLGASLTAGRRRRFWAGAALFGWGYAALTFGPWFRDQLADGLLTSKLLKLAHEALSHEETMTVRIDQTARIWDVKTGVPQGAIANGQSTDSLVIVPGQNSGKLYLLNQAAFAGSPLWEHFSRVGQSLWTVGVVLIGGWVSRYLFGDRSRDRLAAHATPGTPEA
jgi:hypothetical protein